MELLQNKDIKDLIEMAIREDVGPGDHTSLACIPTDKLGRAYCVAKQDGIIAGIELANYIFKRVDSKLVYTPLKKDGDLVQNGDHIFTIEGSDISILTAERLVLNFMQRLSGIATQSHQISELLKDYHTTILDTRKTTPGMRLLEKWAVKLGGCSNHRMGLYDMVMIKDNHIDFAGGIKQAIEKTKNYLHFKGLNIPIEIETRTLDEVQQVLDIGGVNRIMLDNFKPELLEKAIALIDKRFETEASGGITMETIKEFAATGVDFISVGALTHSSKSLDLSLRVG
ncbi:MAG: carboxylating nicotinate-nucleotide diphosphorylase [Bacteroidia bacterium]|nr:carboxylating nicotinate-nucleotide diphosphorylase [Bacteroidia bacterium]MCF8446704.1 carboxylating nicotinate-nucleotide diphosphorylase [Bacteroidia bacterium]